MSEIPIRKLGPNDDLGYVQIQRLGSGSFGEVYEVQSKNEHIVYANKVMRLRSENKDKEKEMREALRKEVECIQRVHSHRHILRVYDAYQQDSRPDKMLNRKYGLIVWPAADGGNLRQHLDDISRNSRDVVERAFGCLAHGLKHMHENNIRHKDIKPANILIHQGEVIWSDFGLAKNSSDLENSILASKPVGSRKYWAPELEMNVQRRSKSDVYALGCVYIEMLAALEEFEPKVSGDFNGSMKDVWAQLDELFSSKSAKFFLVDIIKGMTQETPSDRWTAATVFEVLASHHGYRCDNCPPKTKGNEDGKWPTEGQEKEEPKAGNKDSTDSPWTWSPQYNQFYRTTRDEEGNLRYIWHSQHVE